MFSIGFRPFFLLAAAGALLPVLGWMLAFAGHTPPDGHYSLRIWHAHELLFGYAVAVMAGFLLTAIRNWSGRMTAHGAPLAALASLWLAGRLVSLPWSGAPIPGVLVALVDVAFLPALAFAAALPLVQAGQRRNYIFPGMLLLLGLANALLHASLLGWLDSALAERALEAAAMVAIVMIGVMAGRVFPFFTERGLDAPFKATVRPWIEKLAPLTTIAFALSWLLRDAATLDTAPLNTASLLPIFAALACIVHGIRLAGWYTPLIWRAPLVWVLHVGYAWLVAGFALAVAVGLHAVPFQAAMHAFTAGTIGTVTIGMMARVSLGHTGRPLRPSSWIVASFVLLTLAAVLRVWLPLIFPAQLGLLVQLAGAAWIAAFVLFLVVYVPILTRPRVDSAPG